MNEKLILPFGKSIFHNLRNYWIFQMIPKKWKIKFENKIID